jgi:hypothetical protein
VDFIHPFPLFLLLSTSRKTRVSNTTRQVYFPYCRLSGSQKCPSIQFFFFVFTSPFTLRKSFVLSDRQEIPLPPAFPPSPFLLAAKAPTLFHNLLFLPFVVAASPSFASGGLILAQQCWLLPCVSLFIVLCSSHIPRNYHHHHLSLLLSQRRLSRKGEHMSVQWCITYKYTHT